MLTTRPTRSRWVVPWGTPASSLRARTDDELLTDVGAGDHEAFAILFDHTAGLVCANIRRALHDESCTEAVVEAAYIEVWRQAAQFDPSRTPAVIWILDLAHQLAAEQTGRPVGSTSAARTEPRSRATQLATAAGYPQYDPDGQLDTPLATVPKLFRRGLLRLRAAPRDTISAPDTD